MNDIKSVIRIANQVQDALLKLRTCNYIELLTQLSAFAGLFQQFTGESKRLGASLVHGWLSAANECRGGIERLIDDMKSQASMIERLNKEPEEVPALSNIVEELRQLRQEFDKVSFDKKKHTISVITKPITLMDIYLGPFEIQLKIKKLAELFKECPYYCIALDPHPASSSEDVTHPHVSGDRLCEGEGYAAIRKALEQGRLCDFFTLVMGILNTYSPDSPYVALENWDGTACYDCGYIVDSENSYYCEHCDNTFCEECTTCCRSCDETVCLGCLQSCSFCDERVCPSCISKCADCGSRCCSSCLDEDICPDCKDLLEKENEERTEQDNRNNENTGTAETKKPEAKLAG